MTSPSSSEQTVYVTGANGTLGVEVCRTLRESGFTVKSVSRNQINGDPHNISTASVFDPATWLAEGDRAAAIVHLAGLANPRFTTDNELRFHEEFTQPHGKMFEKLRAAGWTGKLIYASSGGTVYGDAQTLPIPETHPCQPLGLYGRHKVMIENMIVNMWGSSGTNAFVLRISNLYGASKAKANQGVIPILADHLRSGKQFTIFGDGTAVRDYIHANDVCSAIMACLDAPQSGGGVYNIGSGIGISLNQLIHALEGREGRMLDRSYQPTGVNVGMNYLDCSKAFRLLGWKSGHDVLEDIAKGNAGI